MKNQVIIVIQSDKSNIELKQIAESILSTLHTKSGYRRRDDINYSHFYVGSGYAVKNVGSPYALNECDAKAPTDHDVESLIDEEPKKWEHEPAIGSQGATYCSRHLFQADQGPRTWPLL